MSGIWNLVNVLNACAATKAPDSDPVWDERPDWDWFRGDRNLPGEIHYPTFDDLSCNKGWDRITEPGDMGGSGFYGSILSCDEGWDRITKPDDIGGSGFYGSLGEAMAHGACVQVSGDPGGAGFYV